jgi:Rrf2 family protein
MLLTRRACYGLLAAQHLAEHAGEGSCSANDLAEFYGLPHEALAKILQRLATAGVLMSHHGIKGGYTLARDPRYISVLDVIRASHGSRWSSLHSERQQRLGIGDGHQPLRMVSQLVEDMLRELTIEDIEEKVPGPAGLLRDSSVRASQLDDQTTRSH